MEEIEKFLKLEVKLSDYGSGDGYGSGSGDGYGSGSGDGSGYGYGSGSGDGYGYGSGYGSGDGYGYGSGDGDGYGYGDGSGDGYGYGDGSGSGDGDGSGDGYGDGDGDGSGSGYGDGDGYGSGDGSGDGYGDGYGSGLKTLNNQKIYLIDAVQTIIESVKGNVARGFIVNKDLTLQECYIAKGENTFSHGETLKKAVDSLQQKLLRNLPTEERIKKFKEKFKDFTEKFKAVEFYDWHFFLTGSCEMGRNSFVKNNGIDLENDLLTVNEFIQLTKNSYGGETINLLKS